MTKVVTVLNQKGGVGKSTATVNLAAVRAQKLTAYLEPDAFSPVAAVSIDPQGSAKWWANRVDALPFHLVQAHDDPLEWLQQLNNLPGIVEVYVDTAGWFDLDADSSRDGLGDGYSADALRTVLDVTAEAIVPVLPAPMCFDPTARTIRKLLEPRNIPYRVFINDWDPRDGEHWLKQTQKFIRGQGWPLAETVVRHYKIHTNACSEGVVVTQYKKSGSAANAAADFYKLADELNMVAPLCVKRPREGGSVGRVSLCGR
ncbi:ParA family protein [Mycobacterium avium]|uniref:ParA family protein n=1 Tax=Mycobacterium avium TaxID=1764 RepID=UPI002665C268|nr:ParA family protein [Mycobacterium avium]MDO2361173.1 ParA family protein [Mycobacterium avium subsp. hominissuis]